MFRHHRPHPDVHIVHLRGNRAVRHVALGGALVVVGIAKLLEGQGLISPHELWLIAPALVALSGVARLAVDRSARGVVHALLRCAIAAYLFIVIEHVGGWTFAATWPALLIGVGIANVVHALVGRRGAAPEPNW